MLVALRYLVKYTLLTPKVPQRQIDYFTRFRSATTLTTRFARRFTDAKPSPLWCIVQYDV
jgi:hypothetical protein